MSPPTQLPVSGLVVTSFAVAGLVLPVLALIVAIAPYVLAGLVALFRRDPAGPFVSHRSAVVTRALAVLCLMASVLALVAVQPRYFRRAPATMPARADAGGSSMRASIAPDVHDMIDSLPCAAVVVGIVQSTGNEVLAYGRRSVGEPVAPDGETVFEIGGMTQTLTATLLARLAEKGVVALDQPVKSLLPDTVSVPMRDGQFIELQHLATWSSGLPRLEATQASPFEWLPPFSRAGSSRSAQWLYDLLSRSDIRYPPGTHVDDSDLGMGLLGHALERASSTDFATLLQREVCGPLGMSDTRVTLTPGMQSRLATGMTMGWGSYRGWYVASPARRWPRGAIPGAADLCSTANDLLTLLRAHLAGFPMESTLAETRRPRLHVEGRSDVAMGWLIDWTSAGDPIVWQHGAAGASRSYMALMEGRGVGVVVLANVPIDVDLLGKKVLNRLLGPGV